jgi:hypothetical protein
MKWFLQCEQLCANISEIKALTCVGLLFIHVLKCFYQTSFILKNCAFVTCVPLMKICDFVQPQL